MGDDIQVKKDLVVIIPVEFDFFGEHPSPHIFPAADQFFNAGQFEQEGGLEGIGEQYPVIETVGTQSMGGGKHGFEIEVIREGDDTGDMGDIFINGA